jgi:hypothetical protein
MTCAYLKCALNKLRIFLVFQHSKCGSSLQHAVQTMIQHGALALSGTVSEHRVSCHRFLSWMFAKKMFRAVKLSSTTFRGIHGSRKSLLPLLSDIYNLNMAFHIVLSYFIRARAHIPTAPLPLISVQYKLSIPFSIFQMIQLFFITHRTHVI